jgi:hypothetical protein
MPLQLDGFQVITTGRFWVIAEAAPAARALPSPPVGTRRRCARAVPPLLEDAPPLAAAGVGAPAIPIGLYVDLVFRGAVDASEGSSRASAMGSENDQEQQSTGRIGGS